MASEALVLCFDEFQVTDIADALILRKFFNVLWDNGVILFATSNRPPQDLYKDGINHQYFAPFIGQLQEQCIVKTIESARDYRMRLVPTRNIYFTPCNEETKNKLWKEFLFASQSNFNSTSEKDISKNVKISVMMNRYFSIPFSLNGCCYLTFKELWYTCSGNNDIYRVFLS
jgi:cell division protein ZapE